MAKKRYLRIWHIFWLVFSIAFTVVFGGSWIWGIIKNAPATIPGTFVSATNVFGLIALWGLGLQRRFLERRFWLCFFVIDVAATVLQIFFGRAYYIIPPVIVATAWSMQILYHIGIFAYAFCSKHIWQSSGKHSPQADITDDAGVLPQRNPHHLRKLIVGPGLIILALTLAPVIIHNNRTVCPAAQFPEFYQPMLEHRRKQIPQIVEFERLFPNYLIEFYAGEPGTIGDARWQFTAGLYGRYLMEMNIDVVFGQRDPDSGQIISPGSYSDITFNLREVDDISVSPFVLFPPRQAYPRQTTLIDSFGLDKWKQLVASSGDFGALGIQLKRDEPVPDFELAFRNNE